MCHFNRFCGKQIILSLLFTLCCGSSVNLAQATKSNSSLVAVVNFQEMQLKMVIKNLATQLKWNVVFDETFRDEPKYDLELKDVTLEAALKIVLIHKHLMARIIEDRTIIIFHDNPTNRARFEEFPAWPAKYDQKR
jgi:PIN domain nuclease of toxin-antitoxin system